MNSSLPSELPVAFGTPAEDRILVALSGGVDSAVCVHILKDQGFAPEGVVISFSPAHASAIEAATIAAQELDIPLTIKHCENLFEEKVVGPFCNSYANGTTPNPCIMCNPNVKFRILADTADELGIKYIATGHYARVAQSDNGDFCYIAPAESSARDQSYMLYGLGQDILQRLCLPLGEFEKSDIREMATAYGLSSADAPDSQEICFIPDGDYARYIEDKGIASKQGRFIGPEGEDLGPHKGVVHYTIGQRRGIGISYKQPIFVKAILPTGDVQLAYSGQEYAKGIEVSQLFFADGNIPAVDTSFLVKIRSRAAAVPCVLSSIDSNTNTAVFTFEEAQRAPAPGQAAVLYRYDNEYLLGGGIIIDVIDTNF